MRVPETTGVGIAKVTVSFDAWKEGKVASTKHDVPIVLPKRANVTLETVSSRLIRELIHPNKTSLLVDIRFDPVGKRIIAGDYPGGIVALWDVETGKRLTTIETGNSKRSTRHYFFVTPDWKTLFVSRPGERKYERVEKDGKQLLHWKFDGDIRAWDLATGKLKRTYRHDPPRHIGVMALSPDGGKFYTWDWLPGIQDDARNYAASLWDAKSGKFIDLGKNLQTYSIFSPDGKSIAATTLDSTALMLLDTATGKETWSIPVKEKNARVFISSFSPDGKRMLVTYQVLDKANDWKNYRMHFDVLETATGKKIASLAGEKNESNGGYFSPDNQTLAVNRAHGEEHKLFLFSIAEDRVMKTINLGKAPKGERLIVSEPAFSLDGKKLAIVTQMIPDTRDPDLDALDVAQPRVLLFDVESGALRESLVLPQGFSQSACFSPEGRTLAIGGHGRILLWDVTDNAAKERRGQP